MSWKPDTINGWVTLAIKLVVGVGVVATALATHAGDHTTATQERRALKRGVAKVTAYIETQMDADMSKWATIQEMCVTGRLDPDSDDCKLAPMRLARARATKAAADRAAAAADAEG